MLLRREDRPGIHNINTPTARRLVGWFDATKAEWYPEGDMAWNGQVISLATGSTFDHETLIRTKGGRWVLQYSDDLERERVYFVTEDEALEWLVRSHYSDEEISRTLRRDFPEEFPVAARQPDCPMSDASTADPCRDGANASSGQGQSPGTLGRPPGSLRINVFDHANKDGSWRNDQTRRIVGWFDSGKASHFAERTEYKGGVRISLATGASDEHEDLYRTAGGQWVIQQWLSYAPYTRTRFVTEGEAREWLVRSQYRLDNRQM